MHLALRDSVILTFFMYMYLTAMSKFNSGHSHLDLKIRESSYCAFIFKTVLCSQLHVYNRYIRVMILIFLKIKKTDSNNL